MTTTSKTATASATGSTVPVEAPAAGRSVPVRGLNYLVQAETTYPGRWRTVQAESVGHAGAIEAVRVYRPFLKADKPIRVEVHVASDDPENLWPGGNPRTITSLTLDLGPINPAVRSSADDQCDEQRIP